MSPQSYHIVVVGRLRHRFADGFDNMTQHQDGSNTVLSAQLADQAALAGLLDQIRGLGITITSFALVDKTMDSDQVTGHSKTDQPTRHGQGHTTRKATTWTTP